MGPVGETRLLLVERASGKTRDAFRVGQGTGVVVERVGTAAPEILAGSNVGVISLVLSPEAAPAMPRVISGRVTGTGASLTDGALADFPLSYEASAPGWPIRTVTTDARGNISVAIDAPDVVPLWLDGRAIERHRSATGRGRPRWACVATPRSHFMLGPTPGRVDSRLTCFDPHD